MTKPNNTSQLLDFLLTADFNRSDGYSYPELLEFLKYYKTFYKSLYIDIENSNREINQKEKVINNLNSKIKQIENIVERQEKQINNLKNHLSRNLSIWERITGKIKF